MRHGSQSTRSRSGGLCGTDADVVSLPEIGAVVTHRRIPSVKVRERDPLRCGDGVAVISRFHHVVVIALVGNAILQRAWRRSSYRSAARCNGRRQRRRDRERRYWIDDHFGSGLSDDSGADVVSQPETRAARAHVGIPLDEIGHVDVSFGGDTLARIPGDDGVVGVASADHAGLDGTRRMIVLGGGNSCGVGGIGGCVGGGRRRGVLNCVGSQVGSWRRGPGAFGCICVCICCWGCSRRSVRETGRGDSIVDLDTVVVSGHESACPI